MTIIDQPTLPSTDRLTARQREIVTFIAAYRSEHYMSPTLREIGDGVGLSSLATVHHHLDALVRLGVIRLRPFTARSAVPIVKPSASLLGAAARIVREAGTLEVDADGIEYAFATVPKDALDALAQALVEEGSTW